jgi:hypothetical protein
MKKAKSSRIDLIGMDFAESNAHAILSNEWLGTDSGVWAA